MVLMTVKTTRVRQEGAQSFNLAYIAVFAALIAAAEKAERTSAAFRARGLD